MAAYDIRRAQLVELEILGEFDRVCRLHGLTYFLDSGTALGAVRHGGFIPWDDDIDVAMPRDDYEKLLSYASKDIDTERFFLQTRETDPEYPLFYAKLRRNGTVFLEEPWKDKHMHHGIWIDIFPYDFITGNKRSQKRVCRVVSKLLYEYRIKVTASTTPHAGSNTSIKSLIKMLVCLCLRHLPDQAFNSCMNGIIHAHRKHAECCTCYYYIDWNGTDNPVAFETDKLLPVTYADFEGGNYPVPGDADYYLRTLYGDYMQLPPIEQRGGHAPLMIDFGESA